MHLLTKDVVLNELTLSFTTESSNDFYFTLERTSLLPQHQAIEKDFEFDDIANEKTIAEEEDVFEGEILLTVIPMIHDITYANDWERGSIVKARFLHHAPLLFGLILS